VIRKAEILLGDLQFRHDLRPGHAAEQRMKRLAWLKINWSILDLQQHIRRKLAVKWLQVFVGSAGAVVTWLHIVDKSAPKYDAIVGRERGGEHVGAVSVRAVVGTWSRLTFAVGLDDETTEVGNQTVDFVSFLSPPKGHCRVKWISGLQPAEIHWCREARGQVNVQAIGAKDARDCCNFLKIVSREYLGIGVDIVES
jgi:hypothetical protein